jgi:hypothetical protein
MSPEQEIADRIKAEYPGLVIEISGTWPDSGWIVNFKEREFGYANIHGGSAGSTMLEALEKGYEAVLEWAGDFKASPLR